MVFESTLSERIDVWIDCPWCNITQSTKVYKKATKEITCVSCKKSIGVETDDNGNPIRIGRLTSLETLIQKSNQKQDSETLEKQIGEIRKGFKNARKKVFVVHGHDEISRNELARLIDKELGLESMILHEQASGGKTLIEKFEKHSSEVGYAFILLTPDDVGGKDKDSLKPRARQNVIFEMGFFIGAVGRDSVCVLHKGNVELPSDMAGIVYIPYSNSVEEAYLKIRKELLKAGYKLKSD